MQSGRNIYVINDRILKQAKPDLIITQGVCEVCAPFTNEVNRGFFYIGLQTGNPVLDPHDLDEILVSIMDIAERVDRAKEGRKVVASLQNRIDDVRIKAGQRSTRTGNKYDIKPKDFA